MKDKEDQRDWFRTLACTSIVLRWQVDQILETIKNETLKETHPDVELLSIIDPVLDAPTPVPSTEISIAALNSAPHDEVAKVMDKVHAQIKETTKVVLDRDLPPLDKIDE